MSRTAILALCAVPLLLWPAGDAAGRQVRDCKLTVKAGKTGTLAGDVRCGWRCSIDPRVRCSDDHGQDDFRCPLDRSRDCEPEQIVLAGNARLDLNGFSLVGTYHGQSAIVCGNGDEGKCTVTGPGLLSAGKVSAITVTGAQDIVLEGLTIARDYYGISTGGWVRATDVTIECDGGVFAGKGLRATHVSTRSNCSLASGRNLYLDGVDLEGGAFAANTLRGRDVSGGTMRGKDIFLTRASVGPVHSEGRLVLRDSAAGDVESGRKPVLVRSTCMRSRKTGTSETWGVCALD